VEVVVDQMILPLADMVVEQKVVMEVMLALEEVVLVEHNPLVEQVEEDKVEIVDKMDQHFKVDIVV
tara:strand:+ start:131 stop:328 length:198 start_codon:yes stop_codon:yes gene_type:complete